MLYQERISILSVTLTCRVLAAVLLVAKESPEEALDGGLDLAE
ncbi:MAG: hypothetical protein OXR72_04085 [Gemmatimonadota bacterium]|nr:hypothetical protein [Gemmatimonadota bacterium]